MVGSGGKVICNECPGRDDGGHLTRTRLVPAWTVNSAPGLTPGGTVTRYTCPGPVVVRVTAYAPGREVAADVDDSDPDAAGGTGCPPEDVDEEFISEPGGAETPGGADAARPPTVDPRTTTFDPAIPAIPPMGGPAIDDNIGFVAPPPTRGGTPGIPDGGVNMLVDNGGAPGAAAGGPTPDTLIPGYVCRLLEAWLFADADLCCCC